MSERLHREIEDIVEKAGNLPPPPRRARHVIQGRSTHDSGRSGASPMRFALILGVVLLIGVALLVSMSGSLGTALALGALILLGAAYISYFRNGRPAQRLADGSEKRWRGQTVYEPPRSPSILERLRSWRNRRR